MQIINYTGLMCFRLMSSNLTNESNNEISRKFKFVGYTIKVKTIIDPLMPASLLYS